MDQYDQNSMELFIWNTIYNERQNGIQSSKLHTMAQMRSQYTPKLYQKALKSPKDDCAICYKGQKWTIPKWTNADLSVLFRTTNNLGVCCSKNRFSGKYLNEIYVKVKAGFKLTVQSRVSSRDVKITIFGSSEKSWNSWALPRLSLVCFVQLFLLENF